MHLVLSPAQRVALPVLNVLPLPGVGAVWTGIKNPHSRYLWRGVGQIVLVLFGSWPLIVPGAAGLAWAVWDAVQIRRQSVDPPAWSRPAPDAPPESLPEPDSAKRAPRRSGRRTRRAKSGSETPGRRGGRGEGDRDGWWQRWRPGRADRRGRGGKAGRKGKRSRRDDDGASRRGEHSRPADDAAPRGGRSPSDRSPGRRRPRRP